MNTKKGLLAITMLIGVQPSMHADWQELWTKAMENPQQSITTLLGGVAFVATAFREVRKFLKTPEAKQAKYDGFIGNFLNSQNIVTTDALNNYVKRDELPEAPNLSDCVTKDALTEYVKAGDTVNFVTMGHLESVLEKYVSQEKLDQVMQDVVGKADLEEYVQRGELKEYAKLGALEGVLVASEFTPETFPWIASKAHVTEKIQEFENKLLEIHEDTK